MPALSEIKTEGSHKILLIGEPGSGKTCFAASMPTPILYFDFDNKVDSAALFHKGDKDRLAQIDVRTLSSTLTKSPMEEFMRVIEQELMPQEKSGEMKFKTLVLDSITTFSTATLDHIMASNPGIKGRDTKQGKMPDKPHYGILLREFSKLIPGLLALPCNVVMCAHLSTWKNEDTGEVVREPMMDGSFSEKLPIFFKEVWMTYRDDKGKHWAQTQSNFKFNKLRSQIPGLPVQLPLSYDELAKYI